MICAGHLLRLSVAAVCLRRATVLGISESCSASASATKSSASCPVRTQSRSMASKSTKTFVIPPSGEHSATVIFLHGLGDTGEGWSHAMRSIASPGVRYVCPTAPTAPVSLNGGFPMPSWFDIFSLQTAGNTKQDEAGIKLAADSLRKLIDEEMGKGVPASRIVIGGFSQGGAVALYTALTDGRTFAGVLALSTWLPLHEQIPAVAKESGRQTPVLQCHGDSDPMVNIQIGQMSAGFLQKFCKQHKLNVYPGLTHSSNAQELADVQAFINKQFAKDSTL